MPVRNRSTTNLYSDTEITFLPTTQVSFQVSNNPVQIEINVPMAQGSARADSWNWISRALPGFWTLGPSDFARYGGNACTGIRFKSDVSGFPGIVDVNN